MTLLSWNVRESDNINDAVPVCLVTIPTIQVNSSVTPSILIRTVNASMSAASSSKASKKTKSGKSMKNENSTHHGRGLVLKSMDRIANSFDGGGNESVESGRQPCLL